LTLLVVVSTLLLSAIRKRLYTSILIGVLAPVLLIVVLFSIPSISVLGAEYVGLERAILSVSSSASSGECYRAVILNGVVGVDNSSSESHFLIINANASVFLEAVGLAKKYNLSSGVILPRELYEALGKPHIVKAMLNQSVYEYSVAGAWRSNLILLVDNSFQKPLELYACLQPRESVLLSTVSRAESDLLDTARFWILLLIVVYVPVVYATMRRVAESLSVDVKLLVESGVSPWGALLSGVIALTVLYAVISLYVYALGIVVVYTAWSLLSYILPLPQPMLRIEGVQLLLAMILMGSFTAYPACRSVLYWRS